MADMEIPTDDDVANALQKLNGHATAFDLCNKLVNDGHPRRESQLAIQRAVERHRLILQTDWSLRVAEVA